MIRSFIHVFTHTDTPTCWFTESLAHWLTSMHWLSLIHRLIQWFIHPLTHSCPDSLMSMTLFHFIGISQMPIIHCFCVSRTFLKAVDLLSFSKLPPRHGHGRAISSMFICIFSKITHLELQYPIYGALWASNCFHPFPTALPIGTIILTGSRHPPVVWSTIMSVCQLASFIGQTAIFVSVPLLISSCSPNNMTVSNTQTYTNIQISPKPKSTLNVWAEK